MKKQLLFLFFANFILAIASLSSVNSAEGIVNKYVKVIEVDTCKSAVKTLTIDYKVGDYVLLIQMQGAEMTLTNTQSYGTLSKLNSAGLYEFGYIEKIEDSTSFKWIYFTKKLVNNYQVDGSVQLVYVPQYEYLDVIGNINALSWDGDVGGVIAFEVKEELALMNGNIDASGTGFRGGINSTISGASNITDYVTDRSGDAGMKGEGVCRINTSFNRGIGRSINGGGGANAHNGGGGGGSNVYFQGSEVEYEGGVGGNSLNSGWAALGGLGGKLLIGIKNNYNRLIMGGGGGGGQTNENFEGIGGNGGGIIIVKAGTINSNGFSFISNGNSGEDISIDGAGGGGGGGTVFISGRLTDNINIELNGGKGGDSYGLSRGGAHLGGCSGGGGSVGKAFLNLNIGSSSYTIKAKNGVAGYTDNISHPQSTGFYPGKDAIGEELAAKDLDVIKELVVQSREKTKLSVKDTLATIYDICKFSSNSITLHAPTDNPNYNYKWNTGETSQSIKVTKPGIYESVITAGCDTYSRTYSVIGGKIEYRAELTPYEGKCGIDSMKITITPITDGVNFNWADGFTKLTRTFSKNGEFKLTLTKNNYCDSLITFNYRIGNGSFDSTFNNKNISYMSKARTFGSDIKMTDVEYFIKGSAWYNNKLSLRNNFSIDYSFSCSDGNNGGNDDGSLPGADGIVLVFQNNSIYELGLNGGGIGYQGIKNGLAFEIDLFKNTAPIYDVNGNHFAVQKSSKELGLLPDSSNSLFVNKDIIEIKENTRYYATMIYDASEKKINYYLDTVTPPNKLIMSKIINPLDYVVTIDGYSYFGFTSATGVAMQVYKIHDVKVCGTVQTTSVDWEEENLFEIDRIYSRIEVYNSIGKLVTTIENNNLLSSFNEVSKGIPLLIKITDKNVSFTKKIVAE